MMSLLEKLQARASVSRARVQDLRAQIAVLQKQLAVEEERLARWAVAEEAVAEVLAEGDAAVAEEMPIASRASAGQSPVAAATVERVVISAPVRRADGEVLSEANEDVVLALASAGRPLRSRQICEAVGQETDHRRIEGMRTKLKRLVKQGWLAEGQVGLFTIAPGVGDAPAVSAAVNGTAVEDV
ncbi:hypothetical protein AB0I66_42835 [Streptomyces sp. NPDC050439]|uniref:hypothetical protein n=1 Tax=unclassified Streptomyces TaxID=2593676 RepID=UPI003422CE22